MKTKTLPTNTGPTSQALRARLETAQAACDETKGQLALTCRAAMVTALHYRDLAYCQAQGMLPTDDAEVAAVA